MQRHQHGGARWSEGGTVKDEGLRAPLAWGVWGDPMSASKEQPPHLPLLSGFPEKEVAGGVLGVAAVSGWAAPGPHAAGVRQRWHSPTISGAYKAVFWEMPETKSEHDGLLRNTDLWLNC